MRGGETTDAQVPDMGSPEGQPHCAPTQDRSWQWGRDEEEGDLRRVGPVGRGASTHESGTMMRKGPLMRLCSMRYVMSAMVWMVLPRPISSARIPFRLLLYSDTSHSRPLICGTDKRAVGWRVTPVAPCCPSGSPDRNQRSLHTGHTQKPPRETKQLGLGWVWGAGVTPGNRGAGLLGWESPLEPSRGHCPGLSQE